METIIHTRDTVPAWYQLGFDEDSMSIVIKIHGRAVYYMSNLKNLSRALPFYKDRCSGEFNLFKGGHFGFGGVFTVFTDSDWTNLHAKLPVMFSNGRPHSSAGYEKDLWMSLGLLFNLLLPTFDAKTDDRIPQHIVMGRIGLEVGRGRAGLSLTFTPHMARWLSAQLDGEFKEVVRVMEKADKFMWENNSAGGDYRFRAEKRGGGFGLGVPGDGCWVNGERSVDERGFELDSHNVDGLLQLLTFLVGLCKLQELALSGTELSDSFL